MSSGTGLPPHKHASFAVSSRLISCLVTEKLLQAYYMPTPVLGESTPGVMVVHGPSASPEQSRLSTGALPDDIFVVVPLLHVPVLERLKRSGGRLSIGLIDPLDMAPRIYCLGYNGANVSDDFTDELTSLLRSSSRQYRHVVLQEVLSPITLWTKFAKGIALSQPMSDTIAKELQSSLHYQYLAYKTPPRCPDLDSASIEWEQSLVSGHPTHPMHRARLLPFTDDDYDWYHPQIRFVQVARDKMILKGSFESISKTLISHASKQSGNFDLTNYLYIPVHELQVPNIAKLFPDANILSPDIHLDAEAQTSIRTVTVAELPGHALKLAIGVKISSSLRTISHFTADFGPRFSAEVVPKLRIDQTIFSLETEPSSAVYQCDNPEIQKHFTAVIRKEYELKLNENVIVIAALFETDHSNTPPGVSAVTHAFGLNTERKRIEFLDRYIELSCKALLPALVYNGVAFEAHAQNMLLRIDRTTGKLTGFILRDLGGLRIHPPTLRQSTGTTFQFLPEHCVATETLQDIYPKFYHTYVHNHIQRLVRLLDLHDNGIGWDILRRHMNAVIPVGHELRKLWLSPSSDTVDSKCLMRMRLQDSYRENIYQPLPNMIQYRPQKVVDRIRAVL